ncbi:MAG: fimbrillin family protein [Alistipes sp.]|nr:fimbrillin family protein [Alistipes sp.]
MKKLFISLLAVAALASCAKEDVIVADPGELIGFNSFVENSTRATDPTYGTVPLTSFNVYGTVQGTGNGVVNIYDGDVVTGAVGQKETITDENGNQIQVDKAWSCDVKQYWIAGAQYNFAAVVDVDKNTDKLPDGVTVDGNGMPMTIDYTTANQNDLLYAKASATGKATGNGKVNFTFDHLLSKAQFTVKSNTEGGYYYSVKNITVTNYAGGTYTVADGTWAPGNASAVAFGNVEYVTEDDTNGKTNATQMLLVPTTTDFKVSFTVEIWNGDGQGNDDVLLGQTVYADGDSDNVHNALPVTTDLVKGNTYNFNLNLSVGELIQFTVTTNPTWANGGDTTLTL